MIRQLRRNPTHKRTPILGLTTESEAHPLPLGKLRVFVFEDNAWANGANDSDLTSGGSLTSRGAIRAPGASTRRAPRNRRD